MVPTWLTVRKSYWNTSPTREQRKGPTSTGSKLLVAFKWEVSGTEFAHRNPQQLGGATTSPSSRLLAAVKPTAERRPRSDRLQSQMYSNHADPYVRNQSPVKLVHGFILFYDEIYFLNKFYFSIDSDGNLSKYGTPS